MRIGFDATPLLVTRAGIGKYTHALLCALGEVASDHDYLLYANQPIPPDPTLTHAYYPRNYFPRSRWLWEQAILPRTIQRDQVDLFHFPNNSASLATRTPYVVTIHDASLFLHRQYHPWQRVVALRLMMPQIARRAAKIITVSHHARRELQRVLKLPAEKFTVIYQGVGEHFRPITTPATVAELRKQHNLPAQYILYVGTLEPRKNLRRLVEAFSQLKRCSDYRQTKLVIVGANGWHMPGFEQQIDALNLRDCIVQLGYVPEKDLPAIYALATCLAFPSLHEGFGIPPLEALACGTPVLTSQNSAMSEICADAAYFVDPTDIASIKDGLHALLCNPVLQGELRAAGFVRVRDFTWQRTAQKSAELYAEVVA